jgi:predicted dehydrogenase
MSESDFSRRAFLQGGAALAGSVLAPAIPLILPTDAAADTATGDKIRFGIIGVGMQGSDLLTNAIEVPGVQCVAACDLYDGRHTLAKEIAGPSLRTTRRYHDLLEDSSIQCVIAAVPDHWHRQIFVDAVSAGKDIYCEKPMSHSAADGVAMAAAAKKSGRIVQIGSQRISSAVCAKAKEMIAQGVLGDLNLIEGSLGRNDPTGAWVYPPPTDLSPQTLDWDTWQGTVPKKPFDALTFARWRCWKEYGTGVAGDLLVHLVSGMMFMLGTNQPPQRVSSLGGILRWKDGRNMPDVQAALFDYGSYPVYLRLNLGSETPEIYRFYGSKGILEVTEFTVSFAPQPGVDLGPSYYVGSYPRAMREAYLKQWHEEHDPDPLAVPGVQTVTYKGASWDLVRPHLANFFKSVRTREPLVEDAEFGHHAALACHMANESYFRKTAVGWDPASGQIRNG